MVPILVERKWVRGRYAGEMANTIERIAFLERQIASIQDDIDAMQECLRRSRDDLEDERGYLARMQADDAEALSRGRGILICPHCHKGTIDGRICPACEGYAIPAAFRVSVANESGPIVAR